MTRVHVYTERQTAQHDENDQTRPEMCIMGQEEDTIRWARPRASSLRSPWAITTITTITTISQSVGSRSRGGLTFLLDRCVSLSQRRPRALASNLGPRQDKDV